MKDAPPDQLTQARFKAALQTRFRVLLDTGPAVELELKEVTEGRATSDIGRGKNFSMIFRGPADRWLPQRMYSFEHDAVGRFDLFIVPVGQEPSGFLYQAIFNRSA